MTDPYKIAWEREKRAREHAEKILEDKSRELYLEKVHADDLNKELLSQQRDNINIEKLAALGTLSAGIAHEINNPLAFVVSNIYVLKKNLEFYVDIIEKNGIQSEFIKDIEKFENQKKVTNEIFSEIEDGLGRVKEIVNSLKSYSRTVPKDREKIDPNEAARSAVKMCQSKFKENCNIKLSLNDLPMIYANFNEFMQVFINLLINASEAIPDSREGRIHLESFTDDESIIFTCKDNGSGIKKESMTMVFNPFFTEKPVGVGTGLGLSVTQSIINGMGGSIVIADTSKKGTTFKIKVPKDQRKKRA